VACVLPLVIMITYMTIFKSMRTGIIEDENSGPIKSAQTVDTSCKFLSINFSYHCADLIMGFFESKSSKLVNAIEKYKNLIND